MNYVEICVLGAAVLITVALLLVMCYVVCVDYGGLAYDSHRPALMGGGIPPISNRQRAPPRTLIQKAGH